MLNSRRIKETRLKLGLTQLNVSDSVNISQTHYCNIENGKEQPSFRTLEKIAAALGVSASCFISEGAEDANPLVSRKVAAKLRKSGAMSPCTAGI